MSITSLSQRRLSIDMLTKDIFEFWIVGGMIKDQISNFMYSKSKSITLDGMFSHR